MNILHIGPNFKNHTKYSADRDNRHTYIRDVSLNLERCRGQRFDIVYIYENSEINSYKYIQYILPNTKIIDHAEKYFHDQQFNKKMEEWIE